LDDAVIITGTRIEPWTLSFEELLTVGAALAVGFIVAVAVARLMVAVGPRDRPDGGHKAHAIVTPSGGGIAILAGAASAVLAAQAGGLSLESLPFWVIATVTVLAAVLGLVDDTRHLEARTKLVVQAILAGGLVLLPGWNAPLLFTGTDGVDGFGSAPDWLWALSVAGSILWIVVCANAVNFQDGANGLAMGSGAISLLGMAALAWLAVAPLDVWLLLVGLAVGCGGFLVWNMPAGRLFAGDTGSLAVGFAVGAGGLMLAQAGVNELLVALCVLPMLADVILTVVWRIRHDGGFGVLTTPHRHHLYQWMLRSGLPVTEVAPLWWLKTAVCCLLALGLFAVTEVLDRDWGVALVAVVFVAICVGFAMITRRWRHEHEDDIS
jgi:UDP-GlcNAc:undecaprenyl-phosphate/decaprenyl-phosphate GlcNAc-1-phosphate transferase